MLSEPRSGIWTQIARLGPAGSFPFAPGTAGSVVGVVVVAALHRLPLDRSAIDALVGAIAAGIYCLGVPAAGRAEQTLGVIDPGSVVIDELAGQMIALLTLPAVSWKWLLAGFLLFRFFDVLKPFPARRFEHLRGGWGIMSDDVVAGAYGALGLFVLGFAMR